MKKIYTIFIFSLIAISVNAQGYFEIVKDKNKNNQLKSMEFMQWKFTPKWYYYKWHWWNNPLGLGLHSNYVSKDRRNILQETPMILAVAQSRKEAEKEHQEVDLVYRQELAKFTDREIDLAYLAYKSRRDELVNNIFNALIHYEEKGGDPNIYKPLSENLERILTNIGIIHNSHMSNAKKREAYNAYDNELTELEGLCRRLSILLITAKK